jgi:glycerophosphoryl diester phosphodiesterase
MAYVDSGLPHLVAHRGNAADFPENTLEALESAVGLGLRYVEFDVQLTADLVPVVLHDADLTRVAGRPDCVHELSWSTLREIPITEPARFGDAFTNVRVPRLASVVETLPRWGGDVTAFVEVKRASLRRFGHDTVLERIAATLHPALRQCVPISFDLPAVQRLREMTGARIGWVIEQYDDATRQRLREAAPDFVFVDVDSIPPSAMELWRGSWEWAVYEIRDVGAARRCAQLGAGLVETMHVRAMVAACARARTP